MSYLIRALYDLIMEILLTLVYYKVVISTSRDRLDLNGVFTSLFLYI